MGLGVLCSQFLVHVSTGKVDLVSYHYREEKVGKGEREGGGKRSEIKEKGGREGREGGREGRGGQRKAIKIQYMNMPVYMYMHVHAIEGALGTKMGGRRKER